MKPFRLLTLAAFAAATLPRLAHRGMFVDGVTYAAIARNLAAGRGSFWAPSYTETLYPQFHEHPPLGFWLQSLWFRLFGDHLFVERLYALTAALGTAVLITLIWRRLHAGPDAAPARSGPDVQPNGPAEAGLYARVEPNALEWLPVLLWIAVPVVSWALVGNLLETTVALFTTGAVVAVLIAAVDIRNAPPTSAQRRGPGFGHDRAADTIDGWAATGWSVLSGLCIVAAGLTKGPVGLFPLAAPVVFLMLPGRQRVQRALVVQWITVAACALGFWTWGAARAGVTDYLTQQVIPALAGTREVSSSVAIVKTLLQGVMLPLIGAGVLAIAAARRFVAPSRGDVAHALALFLLGLAGTLPILASAKQAGHYLVPAVPLFALAAAFVMAPTVGEVVDRFGTQRRRALINTVSAVLALGAVAASLSPGIGRDRERLADLDAMASTVPRDRTVGICPASNDDWGLHAWFERRFHVSLDAAGGNRRDWFLQTSRSTAGCVPGNCTASTDPRRQLVLMKCRQSD